MSAASPDQTAAEPTVVATVRGRLGHLELNRPRAINALDHTMIGLLTEHLERWRDDPEVRTVALTGRGERGLCAGGDIVALWEDARAGTTESAAFWADEYRLDLLIAGYPKPLVAVMDGIVLGGGVGISAHAAHRVVTERTSIGMPETGIGFFPDVGGTWLLARAPGEIGTHLALTSGRVGPGDAIDLGLADHHVPTEAVDHLLELLATADVDDAIAQTATAAPAAVLHEQRHWIDACYAGDDAVAIARRLAEHPDAGAVEAARALARCSPTSVAVTLAALRSAASMSELAEVFEQDLRLAVRFLRQPDFVEGVRAQVIDKDRTPHWRPATLEEVEPGLFERLAAPLEGLAVQSDDASDAAGSTAAK